MKNNMKVKIRINTEIRTNEIEVKWNKYWSKNK